MDETAKATVLWSCQNEKQLAALRDGPPIPKRTILLHAGRRLADEHTLEHYGIKDEYTLRETARLPGRMKTGSKGSGDKDRSSLKDISE